MEPDIEILFNSLEESFKSVDDENIRSLKDYTLQELLLEKSTVENLIIKMKQILNPHTQEARDLHSRLNAAMIELNRRNIL